jgi:ketosteroid isomerase-like protein
MSQENVEIVEALFRAWNNGDRDGWLAASAHSEVEWSSAIQRQVEGAENVYRGRAELGRFWDEWHALWRLHVEVSEVRDLGDSVLAIAILRTTGKGSGVEVERPFAYVAQFEDGLLRSVRAYLSLEEALETVGPLE